MKFVVTVFYCTGHGVIVCIEGRNFSMYMNMQSLTNIYLYHCTESNSMGKHDGARFSTHDRNYNTGSGCTSDIKGGWWFKGCSWCNLNGIYRKTIGNQGVWWAGYPSNEYMKRTQIMVKCEGFALLSSC